MNAEDAIAYAVFAAIAEGNLTSVPNSEIYCGWDWELQLYEIRFEGFTYCVTSDPDEGWLVGRYFG